VVVVEDLDGFDTVPPSDGSLLLDKLPSPGVVVWPLVRVAHCRGGSVGLGVAVAELPAD
jgi:hypothetical protein